MVRRISTSRYWEEQYLDEENIRQWFNDYKSYYPDASNVSLEQIKKDFLEGEKKEIEECIVGKKKQEQVYAFVENVINNIWKWRKKK